MVVRPPCRLKTCDSCWLTERARLLGVLTSTFEKCRSYHQLPFSIGITPTSWDTFQRWAQRHQRSWFASPLAAGQLWVLGEGEYKDGIAIASLESSLAWALENHDRTRRLRSSYDIKLSPTRSTQSQWQLIAKSQRDAEYIFSLGLELHIDIEWDGLDRLRITANQEQVQVLLDRIGA